MSGAIHNIGSKVDNALDASATNAETDQNKALVLSLWDRTFCGYPAEMVVKLPYYFLANATLAYNTLGTTNQFKVNSIYDFDLTGGGHQPLGRDTWTNIYDYYKVLETRLHVTHHSQSYITGTQAQTVAGTLTDGNSGSNYMAPTFVGGMLDITANPPTTLTSWQEATMVSSNSQQRFSSIKILERIGSRKGTTQHFSMTWTPGMFDTGVLFGATENTWTPVGSDPANLNYFSDVIYNSNAANNTIAYTLQVKAEMLVAFKNVNRTLQNTTN